ncbi:5-formyltetrahydrofolate cyclo-ligase [Bacillus xiapuensis]|uniref:5-formyltetrahydrofolate cyclo-ligase n=1 Tax=Bacillus xiapuensis TaxID=2014075 RepID=UPI000C250268|nr:5-formyltetrahydrofolate cyclo-ligase [Bacillus xiapuensis]
MDKKRVRQQMKNKLGKINKLVYEQLSFQIARRLFALEEWKKARVIGITVSRMPEVDTWQIIKRGWEEGKQITVPKCNSANRSMTFYELISFCELETVYFGLFEPDPAKTCPVDDADIDLLIVPGLAFDKKGYRLGFGGGYYDRFLAAYTGASISLAFSQQMIQDLPVEKHDLPVQKLVTEAGLVQCEPARCE